ncbi:MAG: trypsin-like serine protease [Deltaproteobacteria bacterium]|nr:trypsin-like serine protease [Deltaproteobacteria bacterium]
MSNSGSFRRGASVTTILLGIAVWLLPIAAARAALTPRIVNGLNSTDFSTTGALLRGFGGLPIDANNAVIECSGTLIGCRTFLTAAHCVSSDVDPSHYWIYLQHAGIVAVSSITYNPSYTGLSGNDVAVVKLASDVTGIAPTAINSTHDLSILGVGFNGTIVGFGSTGGTNRDFGIKRFGAVQTANCVTTLTGGEGNDKLVCWDFALPVGPAGQDSDTCSGDSGGPLFMDFNGVTEVVGVTSTGSSAQCRPLDHSWDANVYYNAAWIQSQIGADSVTTCGGIGPIGSAAATVVGNSGVLTAAHLSDTFSINVAGTPSLLRVALNGQYNGTFNPDVYVKQGSPASPANYDCKADGGSMFGSCEIPYPLLGTLSVFVNDASGAGQYQVTTTTFSGLPAVCGNNVREGGEQCDGTDLGICVLGPCQPDCTCPPLPTPTATATDTLPPPTATSTATPTQTAPPTQTPTNSPAATATASATASVVPPSHDAVVLPIRPLNITLGRKASAVTRLLSIKIRNADPKTETPDDMLKLTVEPGDCPAGMTVGAPSFAPNGTTTDGTVVLAGGKLAVAIVALTIHANDFANHNAKAPQRCTLQVGVATQLAGNLDPTQNNRVPVELNVIDEHNVASTAVHESLLKSAVPISATISGAQSAVSKAVGVKLVNADAGDSNPGDLITLSVGSIQQLDGSACPWVSVVAVDMNKSQPGAQSGVTVKGGQMAAGSIQLNIDSSVTTANGLSPARCVAVLHASGPSDPEVPPQLDPSNNTTQLVIDAIDKHDF